MRVGYGWPKVFSTVEDFSQETADEVLGEIVGIAALQDYLLVVFQKEIQLWSARQHRVKLSVFTHGGEVLDDEGGNAEVSTSPASQRIAVRTTASRVHMYRVQQTSEQAMPAALLQLAPALRPAHIVLTQSVDVSAYGCSCALLADVSGVTTALECGTLLHVSWTGHVRTVHNVYITCGEAQAVPSACSANGTPQPPDQKGHIMAILHQPKFPDTALIFSDGSVARCLSDSSSHSPLSGAAHSEWLLPAGGGACCGALSSCAQKLAVGCSDGVTRLWSLGAANAGSCQQLSLADWGHSVESTGAVQCIVWSSDSQALAVGYARQGFAVWTASGCRIMSSLQHRPQTDISAPCWASGVVALAWDVSSLRLLLCERGMPGQLMQMHFVRPAGQIQQLSMPGEQRGVAPALTRAEEEVHVLQGDDRLLFVSEAAHISAAELHMGGDSEMPGTQLARDGLAVHHVPLPHSYASACWPLQQVAVCQNILDIAAAGTHGVVLYDRRHGRWRVFGDVRQEQAFRARLLAWLPGVVIVCRQELAQGPRGVGEDDVEGRDCSIVLHSRFHLDEASVLCRLPLAQVPDAMDCQQGHILLAFAPTRLLQVRVAVHGQVRPNHVPSASLTPVRELNLMSPARPIVSAGLVINRLLPAGPGSLTDLQHSLSDRPSGPLPRTQPSRRMLSPNNSSLLLASHSLHSGSGLRGARMQSGGEPADDSNTRPLLGSYEHPVEEWRSVAPMHCLLLRWGGLLTLVHLDTAHESHLLEGVECVWLCPWLTEGNRRKGSSTVLPALPPSSAVLPASPHGHHRPLLEHAHSTTFGSTDTSPRHTHHASRRMGGLHMEMPWWIYSSAGMHLLFPSTLAGEGASQLDLQVLQVQLDPELQFDPEVFPIGVSLADAAIIGMTQRLKRATATASFARGVGRKACAAGGRGGGADEALHAFCLMPAPQSQPVLPCLLRRQLQHGHSRGARRLARLHQHGPHFSRSLEWLLFTSLDHDFCQGDVSDSSSESPTLGGIQALDGGAADGMQSLLRSAFDLVRTFPQWRDVVVNVSRKTDAVMWPLLYSVVGKPSAVLHQLLHAGQVHMASCLLVVVDSVEGAAPAHALALALVEAALHAFLTDLAAELLRFVNPASDAEVDAFLEPQGTLTPDPNMTQHTAASPGSGWAASSLSPGHPLPVALHPDGHAAAEQSAEALQHEASFAEAAGSPATSPALAAAPEPMDAEASDGQARSWFGFFLGYQATSIGAAVAAREPAAAAITASDAAADLRRYGSRGDLPAPEAAVSDNGAQAGEGGAAVKPEAGQAQAEVPPAAGGSKPSSGSAAVAMAARRLISEHAWYWLDAGHLLRLADLQRALSTVPCSLAALMQVFPAIDMNAQLTASEVVTAVCLIRQEVPFVEQPALLSTAHDLLLLFHYIYAPQWRLAMAICLNQQTHLQQMRQRAPKVLSEVRARLAAEESLREYSVLLQL